MNAHSTSAYSLSLMLHGAFVAAMLFTAFALKDETSRKSTEIFELVAGAGDNWAATEAPALGTPDGVKFQPTPQPAAPPKIEPVAPPQPPDPVTAPPVEASPIVATPIEAVAPPKTEPKKTPPEKTLSQMVEQTAKRKEQRIVNKYRKDEAAKAKQEAAEKAKQDAAEAAARKTMTKDEYDRLNGKKTAANTKTGSASYEKVSTKGITGGVDGGTTDQAGAGGKVLSRAEQDQLATYFTMLRQKVREAHVTPLGVTNQPSARVSFFISASGTISQVKIIRSSGNAEFDQSVVAAFKAVGSIGKRPDERGDTRESEFSMRDTE